MHLSLLRLGAIAASLLSTVYGAAPTDSYTDADLPQSGYLPNHNMDPAVVDSAQFGQLWKIQFNSLELFYAKPLVYTPPSTGVQVVFLASSQNWIRTLNAKTGALINSRQVKTPFLQADIGCTDIPNTIGIIGTPTIDPNTDIAYFYAKTYIPNYRTAGATGVINGVYYFYAVDVKTLNDVPGYPILIDGSVSDNDARKYFVGGLILQRPSLVQVGNYVYAGFGGHCDQYNYTGLVVGVDITQAKIVTNFATEAGPNSPASTDWLHGQGGQGGIWQSGMAITTDGNRLFFVTGNGQGHENTDTPASGSSGCKTLGEAVVNLNIGDGGKLTVQDYFQPYDYQNMDGGDEDFGSGGIALLDSTVFKGAGVSRIAVTAGKNGKIYFLNADNLGGYKRGAGQTDNVLQTIVTNHAVFGGSGSYPLEGGYIYSTPVGYPTYAYKLGFDGSGNPVFSLAGQTNETSAGRVGTGIPTITSFQGKAGTAILWMTDPDAGLRAWYAVPGSSGVLKTINLPQTNGLNKFMRPAFGDTRLYVTGSNTIYCLGSPVNLPLNCTSPVNFGTVPLGSTQSATITCKAAIGISSLNGLTTGDARFEVSNASLPTGPIAAGTTFSFPVKWNLTSAVVQNSVNASYGNTSPGVKSTALTIYSTNAVNGYSTEFPISLTGTEVSQNAYLALTPITLDFGGLVLGVSGENPSVTSTFTLANAGSSPLTIVGYAYTTNDLDDNDTTYTNATNTGGTWDLGYGFTSTTLPAVGSTIQAGNSISVQATFKAVNGTGAYQSYFFAYTNGGNAYTILEGSASTAPVANFSISTSEGGWLPGSNLLMDFGSVAPGSSSSRQIRICNSGGSILTISKSKPPLGVIRASAPGIDLHESQTIPVGDCAYGTVLYNPLTEAINVADYQDTNTWTLNTNDLSFGVHVVQCQGTVHDRTVGPTIAGGTPQYQYLGCYQDSTVTRLLPTTPYTDGINDNGRCQAACLAKGFIFAGTEYRQECYCGNTPPPYALYYPESAAKCTFSCTNDTTQICGGNGGFLSVYYDSTRYTNPNATTSSSTSSTSSTTSTSTTTSTSISSSTTTLSSTTVTSIASNSSTTISTTKTTLLASSSLSTVTSTSSSSTVGSTPIGPAIVQSIGSYGYIGCYIDSVNARTLTGKTVLEGSTGTIENCAAQCAGYTYFGAEYGNECYCGNTMGPGGTLVPGTNVQTTGCNMVCGGNATEYCGGASRMNMYQLGAIPSSSSTSAAISTTSATKNATSSTTTSTTSPSVISTTQSTSSTAKATSSSTTTATTSTTTSTTTTTTITTTKPTTTATTTTAPTTTTPAGPITVQTVGAFSYLGCYTDVVNARTFNTPGNVGTTNTIESCAKACAGYNYFGVEYGAECYCGSFIGNGATPAPSSGCAMPCAGNSTELCGGANRLTTYYKPSLALGGALSQGCWTDSVGARSLSSKTSYSNVMTVELCSTICSAYTYFGVEYMEECYCGNMLAATAAMATDATTCNMACAGNAKEMCGGAGRMNLYSYAPATGPTTSSKTKSKNRKRGRDGNYWGP